MLEPFTPAQKLHAALRRRIPQMAAALVRDEGTGLTHVQVTYRHIGPYEVDWTGTTYRWRPGPDSSKPLPADPEAAADEIGDALGAGRPATS
ncbi:hypothetical protein GCM10010182_67800 [Actinomadura cremea]|nr:hypothetical protein GCM10010182_67800 [Actinomadura cremea]